MLTYAWNNETCFQNCFRGGLSHRSIMPQLWLTILYQFMIRWRTPEEIRPPESAWPFFRIESSPVSSLSQDQFIDDTTNNRTPSGPRAK